MSKITIIPGDMYLSEVFPKLRLSQVIEITTAMPKLLEYTKRYLVGLGSQLGMGDVTANQVLKNLTVPDVNSQPFVNIFEKVLPSLSNFYSYQIIGKLYDAFESDYMKLIDRVYNKTILDPVHYSLIKSSPDTILQDNFPKFYEVLVTLLQQALTNSDYMIGVKKANDVLRTTMFKNVF